MRWGALPTAMLVAALLLVGCEAANPAPRAAEDATATPTEAVASPGVTPRPRPLKPGESVQLRKQPLAAARMDPVAGRLEDQQLDGLDSSLLYDREDERLYLLEDIYGVCFLRDGFEGRPAAFATAGIPRGGRERALLVQFEPYEVHAFEIWLGADCRGGAAAQPTATTVRVSTGHDREFVGGRIAPRGTYELDLGSGDLRLLHPNPPWEPEGLLERWTSTLNQQPLELRREAGVTQLFDAGLRRVLFWNVGTYAASPDGLLLAFTGRRGDHRAPDAFWALSIPNLLEVHLGESPPSWFEWSPDSGWLAAHWRDPLLGTNRAYLVEVAEGEHGRFAFERGEVIGPIEERSVIGWVDAETVLLTAGAYPEHRIERLWLRETVPTVLAEIPHLLVRRLSPDRSLLATSAWGASFALYNTADGERTIPVPLEGVDLGILEFAWSPDGRWLAASRSPGRS
jgi:hypothetical protein